MKSFVLSLSKHELFYGLRQTQAERNMISIRAGSIGNTCCRTFSSFRLPVVEKFILDFSHRLPRWCDPFHNICFRVSEQAGLGWPDFRLLSLDPRPLHFQPPGVY